MGENIKEFINSDGSIISSKVPNIDPKTSAKTTTDKSVGMRTQPYNFTIYNVKLQEKELPYSEEANKMAENPKSFYEFLESVGESVKFEEYFEVSDPKERLKEISRKKAYKMMETILTKKSVSTDVMTKQPPTIEEIKNKEVLLLDKLTKIAETIKEVMSDDEKKVILSYFNEKIR
jgi:hypothetical protein